MEGITNGRAANPSVEAARQAAAHARKLAELELELAKMELQQKARSAAAGAGFGAGAAFMALLAVLFVFLTATAGLATVLPVWASFLIVTGILVALAAIAGLVARSLLKRATPPVAPRAVAEAKAVAEAIKR